MLLYYTAGDNWTWNPIHTPYDSEYVEAFYRHEEEGTGRLYRKDNLTAARPGGDTEYEWRVKRPTDGAWEADLTDEHERPRDGWEYLGVPPYRGRYWAYSREKMREFAAQGRLVYARSGMPNYKRYLDEMPGVPLQDWWGDITPALSRKERVGYPTQKPIALLERILSASSNPGDVVLDPFCGCATALVAAENLERQWVGIDLSPKAVELVNLRLRDKAALFHKEFVTTREDVPRRTDIDAPPNYRQNAHVLYGEQEGHCGGCRSHFEFRHLEVDHIVPRSKGGTDHIENLQLLCGHCNRVKGNRPQEYLLAQLADSGVAAVLASG